jgi:hypothetical protein
MLRNRTGPSTSSAAALLGEQQHDSLVYDHRPLLAADSVRCGHPELPRVVRQTLAMGPYDTGCFTTADPGTVQTRDDLSEFVGGMLRGYQSTGASEWENPTLERFLDALEAFAGARLDNRPAEPQEQPSWRVFAEILATATGYE